MKPMLAQSYAGQPVTGWLMSEKLDGVRCLWTGSELLSRTGKRFAAPGWFTAALPRVPLDGELWMGRGKLGKVAGAVRRKVPLESDWRRIRYCVFDAPAAPGPIADRVPAAAEALRGCPVAAPVDHERCDGDAHVQRRLREVCAGGGEGLVLRKPTSNYRPFRSPNFLKVKPPGAADVDGDRSYE